MTETFDIDSTLTQGHDCLPPYQFISEEVLEQAFDVVAPLLAHFGLKPPSSTKFKATQCNLE